MGEVEPYRYARWPRVSREEVALGRWLSRALPAVPLAAIERAVGDLVGAEVRCRVHLPPRPAAAGKPPPAQAFALVTPEAPEVALFLLEVEPALGALLVDRLLGGTGDGVPAHVPGPLPEIERGVLAYLGARVLADVARGALLLSLEAPAVEASAPSASRAALSVPITVEVGGRPGRARLWTHAGELPARLPTPPTCEPLGALGGLELDLVLDVGRGRVSAAELRACRKGDVVVPDELWDPTAPGAPRLLRGRIAGAARTDFWLACEGTSLRVERIAPSLAPPTTEGTTMTTTTRTTLELAGDAPIELAVEIARVRLPLEELARLRVGEVLTTGRALGEVVTLRAGEKALAVGELVEVEGEVGVRLLRTMMQAGE